VHADPVSLFSKNDIIFYFLSIFCLFSLLYLLYPFFKYVTLYFLSLLYPFCRVTPGTQERQNERGAQHQTVGDGGQAADGVE